MHSLYNVLWSICTEWFSFNSISIYFYTECNIVYIIKGWDFNKTLNLIWWPSSKSASKQPLFLLNHRLKSTNIKFPFALRDIPNCSTPLYYQWNIWNEIKWNTIVFVSLVMLTYTKTVITYTAFCLYNKYLSCNTELGQLPIMTYLQNQWL